MKAAKLPVMRLSPLEHVVLSRVISKYCLSQVHDGRHFKGEGSYSDAYFVGLLGSLLTPSYV